MSDDSDVPEPTRALRLLAGKGPRLRKRTPDQKRRLREQARRDQQEVCVELSKYLPRPLSYSWEDARRGKNRFWGNIINHATDLVDSDTPPTFEGLLMMADVLAWTLVDLCEERGIPVELPEPPTPVQAALLKRRAA